MVDLSRESPKVTVHKHLRRTGTRERFVRVRPSESQVTTVPATSPQAALTTCIDHRSAFEEQHGKLKLLGGVGHGRGGNGRIHASRRSNSGTGKSFLAQQLQPRLVPCCLCVSPASRNEWRSLACRSTSS